MSINVFHIPFSYKGSTKALLQKALEKIKWPDYSKILYIAPSQPKIQDAQRIFHDIAGDCYIPPSMMTLRQVARRLFSIYENSRIIPQALIPVILSNLTDKSIGYSCLIADFVNEMKAHNPGKEPAEISNHVHSVFYRLGIPEEVSARTMEAMKSLELYRNILLKCNAMDENDIMELCPGIIRQRNIRNDVLIIDSIIELTRTDESIMKTLIENAADTMISIPDDADYNHITDRYMTYLNNNFKINLESFPHDDAADIFTHYAYQDVEEEIAEIARSIKYRFITGTGTDLDNVFVVFPQIQPYLEMITRIFRKYGIPFTIASDRPLAKTKPFLDLMAVLESVSKDYPRLPFSQFLVSPYFKAIPSSLREFIPSLCISSGLTNGKKCWMDLVQSDRNQTGRDIFSKSNYPAMAKDLAAVFRKLSHLEAIRHRASFSDFGEAVIRLLNDFDFDEGIDRDRDNVEAMINTVNELSFVDVFSDNSPTDLRHYTEVLRHCLLSVPSNQTDMTGVRIMSFRDLYGLEPHYLYFGGLRDGDFPRKPEMDHLLPDNVRTELGLLTMERSIQQQKFHFRRALSSAKHCCLSYAAMEGDRLFLPSSFLPWDKEIPKSVCGIYSREEDLIRKGHVPRLSIISDIGGTNRRVVRKVFGEKSAIRVTDIDAYRTCPRKFFIERVLDMRPLEIMKFEIDALTLGTIVHEIMQEIVPDFSPDGDDFIPKARKKIEAILSKKTIESYWKRVVRDTILSVLPVISGIEQTIADDGYVFMAAEVPLQAEVLPGITLKGKIDRIDRRVAATGCEAESGETSVPVNSEHARSGLMHAELIDYKTGAVQFSRSQIIQQGTNLQLLLYAALTNILGMHVERVGIYSLKDVSLSWIPGREDRRNGLTLTDYVSSALHFLKETALRMRAGEFPANPLNDQTCRNCMERPYCPYVQKAVRL